MTDIDRASLEQATLPPKRSGFLRSIGGPQFLVAQLFTIVATILGVYLAGYVGFQRTLQYDQLVKTQEQADLLSAMHAELDDNTTRMRAFLDKLDPTGARATHGKWPELRLYIWTAAARNPAVFDTPPETLAGIQAFYAEMATMLNNEQAQEWFKRSVSTYTFERKQFKERMDGHLKRAEAELVPSIQSAAQQNQQKAASLIDATQ